MPNISWPIVVRQAAEIADSYDDDLKLTVRQLYYRLVSVGAIPHDQRYYNTLTSSLAKARRDGNFPSDRIVDLTRAIHRRGGWDSPTDFLGDVAGSYRRDLTFGQKQALYIGVEKDTLRGLMLSWLESYGLPVLVLRGQASQTYVDAVKADVQADGREAVFLYIGDFDASGMAIDQSFIDRTDCWFHAERISLEPADVIKHNLQAADGKPKDTNFPKFRSDPTNMYDAICKRQGLDPSRAWQWEVEAMEPTTLRAKVLRWVDEYIDHDVLAEVKRQEAVERVQLRQFIHQWK